MGEANPPKIIQETTTIVQEAEKGEPTTVSAQSAATTTGNDEEDDNDIDIVGIMGLVLGAVALVVGTMNLAFLSKMNKPAAAGAARPGDDEEVTLGSKDVA